MSCLVRHQKRAELVSPEQVTNGVTQLGTHEEEVAMRAFPNRSRNPASRSTARLCLPSGAGALQDGVAAGATRPCSVARLRFSRR